MNRIKVILLSAGVHEVQLYHYLLAEADIVTFPFGYNLGKKDIIKKQTIVILWYTAGDKKLFKKIKALKQKFSGLPIILIGKNPTRKDLLRAIKLRVDNFLTLPLNEVELREAIQQLVDPAAGSRFWELPGIRQLGQLLSRLAALGKRKQKKEAAADSFRIVPPHIAGMLAEPQPEKGKHYDLNVYFFEDLRIVRDGKKWPPIRGKKNKSLLAYLLFYHQKPIHREVLMDKFWGDVSSTSARNSLYVAICAIRKYFSSAFPDQEVIVLENDCYAINSELEILTDVEQFNHFHGKGKSIEAIQGLEFALGAYNKALALYGEDFLGRMRYEEWCEPIRANFVETYLFLLNQVCTYFYDRNDYDACINIGRKMLAKDSCLEEIHRKLMRSYAALGLNDLATRQYLKCKEALEEELAMLPSEQTETLFRRIQTGQAL
jgi:DNA-binding SARP family transcriptional activator